ncbi:MAG: hypothetical protein HYZ53_01715 [Planctomycetes bacterium]|nr:hypothetical protein [Planctomycetota bacterium]
MAAAPSRSAPALAVPRRFPDEPVLPPRVVRIDPRELAPEGDDEDPDRRPAFEHVPATASVAELPFGVDVPTYFTPPPSDEPTWIRFEVSQPDPLDPRNFPLRRRPLGR